MALENGWALRGIVAGAAKDVGAERRVAQLAGSSFTNPQTQFANQFANQENGREQDRGHWK
jgi:hypothetical protein